MKNKNSVFFIALSVFIVAVLLMLPRIWLHSDPPIGNVTICDSEKYMDVNSYVGKLIRENYVNPFPRDISAECKAEYYYNYRCNFDGDLHFTVFLELNSLTYEDYISERTRILKLSDIELISHGEADSILFCLPDLEEFYSTEYSQQGFSFDIVEFNEAERTIKYLISYQCDNSQIPKQLSEFVDAGAA